VVSVFMAALGFVLEYALGGGGGVSVGAMFAAMSGSHLLIGLGEGLITAMTVTAVARTRPDLVYALRRRPVESSSDGHVAKEAPHVA
jgi:cobalt/nickel transport system permease protein